MRKLALIGGIVSALAVVSPAAGADRLSLSLAPDAKFPKRELVLTLPQNTAPGDVRVTENGVTVNPRIRAVAEDRRPLSIAVLIDSSNSMRGEALTSAVDAARTLIAGKPARSEVAVFTFARTPQLIVPWSVSTAVTAPPEAPPAVARPVTRTPGSMRTPAARALPSRPATAAVLFA